MPVHCGNDWFPDIWDRSRPAGDEVCVGGFTVGQLGHFLDIGPGSEGLFGAGEDDGASGGVMVQVGQGGVEF